VHGTKTGEPTATSGMTTKVHAPKPNFWCPRSCLQQLAGAAVPGGLLPTSRPVRPDLLPVPHPFIWIASCTKSHSFYNTSTIFFREVRPETILTRSWLTPKCAASFFNSSLLALPRSGCDLIDMTIWFPMTSSCPSELNLTETEYCTCSSWKRVLENLLLARSK